MSLFPVDRGQIKALHGLETPGIPQSRRDASRTNTSASTSSGSWTKPPTPITTPSNSTRPAGTNPYTNRTVDNLHAPKSGNPIAGRTVLSAGAKDDRPAKKQKTVHMWIPKTRKKVTQPILPVPRLKPGQSDDTGLIIVNEVYQDEDMGEPLTLRNYPSSDDLDIIPRKNPVPSSRHSKLPLDGKATQNLRKNHPPDDILDIGSDDDSIQYFDERPRPVNGDVKKKIDDWEAKAEDARAGDVRHIDFSKIPPKVSVKSGMKSKNQNQNQNPVASTSTLPIESHPKPKPPGKQFLPITAWYLGHKLFEEPYYLTWTGSKVTLRSGTEPGGTAHHVEELDIGILAKSAIVTDPQLLNGSKYFALETFERLKATQKPVGIKYKEYFKLGDNKHGQGQIMIKFNVRGPSWSDATYKTFVDWVKDNVETKETMRAAAGDSKWDVAHRLSELAATSMSRAAKEDGGSASHRPIRPKPSVQKPPAIEGMPVLDTWSPSPHVPLPVSIANTVISKRRKEGGPDTPIDLSPPRPPPRPAYKGADVVGAGPSEPARRSARRSVAPQKPAVDPDEVILVYPPGQTGAVNITNGDLHRLEPGEFLNDTLIEFGLKLWLQNLEKENPELAKQIHVFSSFFYKKLNKKNALEGYQSVRKWTSKFDLFEKKYIIIPINENLHWYLAIIYHPEHILLPPPPTKSPSTRRKARQEVTEMTPDVEVMKGFESEEAISTKPDSKASSETRGTPTSVETLAGSRAVSPTTNAEENDVNKTLLTFKSSCSITSDDQPTNDQPSNSDDATTAGTDDNDRNSLFSAGDEMEVDEDPDVAAEQVEAVPPTSELSSNAEGSTMESDTTVTSNTDVTDVDAMEVDALAPANLFDDEDNSKTAINPTNFYGSSAKSLGKRKAGSPPLESVGPDDYDPDDVLVVDEQSSTYIFTLDSLGSRHPKVVTVLSQYLKYEAQEKKGIGLERTSKAIGKAALVPHQPNFCDCGIYLLHLAETFISDPSRYFNLITTKKGNINSVERQSHWNDERTKSLRQTLLERIDELSVQWKKDRAAKEEEKKKQEEEEIPESSDDDIDIVETKSAPSRKERSPRKMGKASRARG